MHWSSVWLYHILSHCCSPSSLESKLHHCLNKLASRQNMQTPLDTKNSLIASGLPALVVTVVLPVFFCLFVFWILRVLWDFSFKIRSRGVTSAPVYIFVPICLPPTGSRCLFLFFTISRCIYLIFISLPAEVWRSVFLLPSTPPSLTVSALGQR